MNAPDEVLESSELERVPSEAAHINKWWAVMAYCYGYASPSTTAERFRVHPEWRHA